MCSLGLEGLPNFIRSLAIVWKLNNNNRQCHKYTLDSGGWFFDSMHCYWWQTKALLPGLKKCDVAMSLRERYKVITSEWLFTLDDIRCFCIYCNFCYMTLALMEIVGRIAFATTCSNFKSNSYFCYISMDEGAIFIWRMRSIHCHMPQSMKRGRNVTFDSITINSDYNFSPHLRIVTWYLHYY